MLYLNSRVHGQILVAVGVIDVQKPLLLPVYPN